jgi:WD40 repeat protein
MHFFDVANKKSLTETDMPIGDSFALAFAPKDGSIAATDLAGFTVWDKPGGKAKVRLEWGQADPNGGGVGGIVNPPGVPGAADTANSAAALSPNHKLLATGWSNGTVRLWKVESMWQQKPAPEKPTGELKGHASVIRCLAFTPGAKRLATGHDDGGVTVWDVARAERLAAFREPKEPAPKEGEVEFPPANPFGKPAPLPARFFAVPRALCFSADGRTVAVVDARGLRLLEVASQKEMARLNWDADRKANRMVFSAAFSADRNQLAVGWDNGEIKLWDLADLWQDNRPPARPTAVLNARGSELPTQVDALAFSADARLLASCSGLGHVKVWEFTPETK